jgi:crotonobetainyl-CoA:carnitine CoA-transferase CaiB-like acyl-CoA transferase
MTSKPLEGITVLDLTNVLAGPFCGHQLVHFGADVIKVEMPGRGDLARQLGAEAELNAKLMGVSFLAQNAGKRSITLNLKHEKGRVLLEKLAAKADIVVENFRPGVMDRLGVGFEALKQHNPKLIYCAVSGFGQDGPMRDFPAYDQIVQGISGVMSITGDASSAPLRVGYPMCDTIGGLTAAMAICAAIAGRDKLGAQFIDVSMLEATLATMGWIVSNHLVSGIDPEPLGNENFTAAPSGAFETGDGLLNIAANTQQQYVALCKILAREDLLDNPDYSEREARKKNRYALKAELEKALATRSATDWAEAMSAQGIPAGAVLTVPEILAHPQIVERGIIGEFEDVPGIERDISLMRPGVKINQAPLSVENPPPELGANNEDVYSELGLSAEDQAVLKEEGII